MSYEVSKRNAKAVERAMSILDDFTGDAGEWLRELVEFLDCDVAAPGDQERVDKLELLFNQYDSKSLKEVEEILEKAAHGLIKIEQARFEPETEEGAPRPLPMALKVFAKEQ